LLLPMVMRADPSLSGTNNNNKSELAELKKKYMNSVLSNRIMETGDTCHFVNSTTEEDSHLLLSCDKRADAMMLHTLIEVDKTNDIIPKLVRGLLASRVKGKWGSTQENVFVLVALSRYFKTYEGTAPDFVSNLWLGNLYLGQDKYSGYSTSYKLVNLPMKYMVSKISGTDTKGKKGKGKKGKESDNTATTTATDEEARKDLIVESRGKTGRLYYRIGMNFAKKDSVIAAADKGFHITRQYVSADNDPTAVVVKNDDKSGVARYTMKAGARIKVIVKFRVTTGRHHIAVVDYLPAGLEILNSAVAGTDMAGLSRTEDAAGKKQEEDFWSWYRRSRNWWDHENLRDERAEAFARFVNAGEYSYIYFARATTEGEFIVPPAKAEEMYSPDVYGRTDSCFVAVTRV